MSAPPTTRSSRSRYSSPAVVGGAARNGSANDAGASSRDRGRDKGKGKARESNGGATGDTTASRSTSMDRSRRFMESWVEPERVRLASFQEDGLIRQGVLENMEPLGTRPKPSVIRKLVGMGREGSPSASNRSGKVGSGKKIILKRKNGKSSLGVQAAASDAPSGTVSPNPSTAAVTPQVHAATLPQSTPAPAALSEPVTAPEISSPTPAARVDQLDTSSIPLLSDATTTDLPEMRDQDHGPENTPAADRVDSSASTTPQAVAQAPPHTNSTDSPSHQSRLPTNSIPLHLPSLATTTYDSSNPFLPDPIKPSIEGSSSVPNLPTTPRSVRSIPSTNYDSDDYFQRETSAQSTLQRKDPPKSMKVSDENQAAGSSTAPPAAGQVEEQSANSQSMLGPRYTEAETTRILGQKDIVKKAFEAGMDEALSHYDYVTAYSFRMAYEHNSGDARFLLQTEAVFRQSATKEAAGEWARVIQRYKDAGAKGRTALKYFVPEAVTDKDYEPKEPLPAPYAHLVSIDLSEVRNLKRMRRPGDPQPGQAPKRVGQPQSVQQLAQSVQLVPVSRVMVQDEGQNEARRNETKAEPERVNTPTPPRNSKRQKTQRDSSSTPTGTARKASVRAITTATTATSASTDALTKNDAEKSNMNGGSPPRRTNRTASNASDVSSLSSLRSATPVPEPLDDDESAQPSKKNASEQQAAAAAAEAAESAGATDENVENQAATAPTQQTGGSQGFVDSAQCTTETVSDAALATGAGSGAVTGASAQAPLVIGLRRAPTRGARNANSTAAQAGSSHLPSDQDLDQDPSTHSHSHSDPDSRKTPDHNNNNSSHPPPPTEQQHPPQPQQESHNNSNQPTTAQTSATPVSSSPTAKPKQQQNHPPQQLKRSQRGMPDFTPSNSLDAGDVEYARRTTARERTLKMTAFARRTTGDSFVRGDAAVTAEALSPPERPVSSSSLSSVGSDQLLDPMQEEPEVVVPKAKGKGRAAKAGGRATRASKRTHDEMDDHVITPFSEDFGREASTATASRATTPRPAKKPKTGRRLKQSPVKNKTAPSAGGAAGGPVPSRTAARASPAMTEATHNQEDNDDFCSACGGNGNLVCCDGCTKSFHCTCHDPPVNPLEDAAWFCLDCTIKRYPPDSSRFTGPFGALLANVEKKHSKAFVLPSDIRNRFEGVRTGADGEYEAYVSPVVKPKKKKADEKDEFDYYQLADADENPVLCHSCHKSAGPNRPIVPCTLCGFYWHADCLDPIRTQPPNVKTFVCPCHIDDLLAKVPAQLGPAHKYRKVRGAPEVVYAYRRGNVNDGHIVIDDDDEDEEVDEQHSRSTGFRDPGSWGRLTRVRGSGIKDDFLSKFVSRKPPPPPRPQPRAQPQPKPQSKPFGHDVEQLFGGALNLLEFSRGARENQPRAVEPPAALGQSSEEVAGVLIPTADDIDGASAAELASRLKRMEMMRNEILDQIQHISRRLDHIKAAPTMNGSDNAEGEPEASNTTNNKDGSDGERDGTEDDEDDRETVILAPEPAVESKPAPEATVSGSPIATTHPTATTARRNSAASEDDKGQDEAMEHGMIKDEVVEVDKMVDPIVESALTPVSDINKESNELPVAMPVADMLNNGIETPETTVADNATSPVAETEAMDLD